MYKIWLQYVQCSIKNMIHMQRIPKLRLIIIKSLLPLPPSSQAPRTPGAPQGLRRYQASMLAAVVGMPQMTWSGWAAALGSRHRLVGLQEQYVYFHHHGVCLETHERPVAVSSSVFSPACSVSLGNSSRDTHRSRIRVSNRGGIEPSLPQRFQG